MAASAKAVVLMDKSKINKLIQPILALCADRASCPPIDNKTKLSFNYIGTTVLLITVAGATSRPLIFARFPRHTGLAPRLHAPDTCHQRHKCHACVASSPVSVTSVSCQCHTTRTSGPVQLRSCQALQLRFPRRFSVFLATSATFQRFPSVSLLTHRMDYSWIVSLFK
jgi:hypothetical protein